MAIDLQQAKLNASSLETQLIALDAKLSVENDRRALINEQEALLHEHEQGRNQLRSHIDDMTRAHN